ncbi:FAD-binding oxidoreductase [Francisella adeliensis]|uniref:Ferredoxin--NADP reductase n=1 Tax=Francisella adeliensis TaxID=2007306 RepID=A0A2Z4XXT8_9GAMM|nr:FAD-binding oxidoreductase [Francisella adeliensis]AXA33272.1 ferredoxin--NADP(+) reductase [Francisella adeliensis]MBK2085002.1 ferredoxin--NADP reductase [Francisella adeliensis]MBK2097007.1 ferredoxin--NADP reductase [Francisella adeliensis]QIW11500.1 ferredoxin--NADP reductase [Francisella adeliensis]QIW13375.1 ferredoxin--NADP reductase [Francisella adeliensis]
MAIERFELELVSFKDITDTVRHLVFKRTDGKPLNFIAGQFITFTFDGEDGKVKRRSYSLGSLPTDNKLLEIAITYVKGGIASEAFFNMQVGDITPAMGPAGRLILKDEDVKKIVLVGTGTGIVPYKSMFPELLERADNTEVHILLGVQYRKDGLYQNDFIEFANKHPNINFKLCLSREIENLKDYEISGYVQHQFESLNLNPETDVVYICGNPNMIDQSFEMLTNAGFGIKSVRREKYISSN